MANDLEPSHKSSHSPPAFGSSVHAIPSPLPTPMSPATPHGEDDGATQLESNSTASSSGKPFLVDARRTQSASNLAGAQGGVSPATSTASSPRNSFTESLSRSGSFFAALNALAGGGGTPTNVSSSMMDPNEHVHAINVVYVEPGPLYVDLYSRADGRGAFVKSFRRRADGGMGNAEACGHVRVNDMLYSINDLVVTELLFASIIQTAKSTKFPCTLVFHSRLPPPPTTPSQSVAASPGKTVASAAGAAGTTWSSKFGQMMAESGMKRSASFDRASLDESMPSPVLRRPSSAASNPRTPPLAATTPSGADTPGKSKTNWSEAINLDKVKNSDGVKNLFRMMGGGHRARPEEDRATVESWFKQLELVLEDHPESHRDGYSASPLVVATTSGGTRRILGVNDDDLSEFSFAWYRKTPAHDLIQIKGVRGGRYFASIDDVDTRVSVRCQSLRFSNIVRVVEFSRPLLIDPAVKEMVEILLEAGAGSFSATLASNEHDSFQIKILEDRVVLTKISEEEDEGGVVVSAPYHIHLQVLVDPSDQLRFTLKVQELGSMLGSRVGDTCDIKRKKSQLAGVSCFFLVAQNPQHRDILVLLIRRFRARAVLKEEEEIAHRDELNLFVDPASCLTGGNGTDGPAVGSFAGISDDTSAASNGASGIANGTHHGAPLNGRRSGTTSSDLRRTSQPKTSVPDPPVAVAFTDMFGVDPVDSGVAIASANRVTVQDPQLPSSRTATFTNSGVANGNGAGDFLAQTTAAIDRNTFVQDRLLAQDKEIAMLQEKLASMSVLIKSTDHEKAELAASLEVKDKRIESHQMRLHQLERTTVQLAASCRDVVLLRSRLDDETKQHLICQQQLAKALEERQETEIQDQATQTDNQVEIPENYRLAMEESQAQVASLTNDVQEVHHQLQMARNQNRKFENEHLTVVAERNALRARSAELAKELKTIVGSHRSLAEVKAQLDDRNHLAMQLSVARAEAKRAADEMSEYKETLDSMLKQQQQTGAADKDKAIAQRLVSHNAELQRLVHQLTDSLNETREQMGAMKKINTALVAKMHHENPGFRGSILESPPTSPFSGATSDVQDPRFSDDEEEDDDDDEGEDEEDHDEEDD